MVPEEPQIRSSAHRKANGLKKTITSFVFIIYYFSLDTRMMTRFRMIHKRKYQKISDFRILYQFSSEFSDMKERFSNFMLSPGSLRHPEEVKNQKDI